MTNILIVANNKGGVGKTTLSVNLAAELAERNPDPVLIIDLDPQGNAADALGLRHRVRHPARLPDGPCISQVLTGRAQPQAMLVSADLLEEDGPIRPNLYLMPATPALDKAVQEVSLSGFLGRNDPTVPQMEQILLHTLSPLVPFFSWIVVDCPPNLNDLRAAVYRFGHKVIVPVSADYLSGVGVAQHTAALSGLRAVGVGFAELAGVIPTKFDPRRKLDCFILAELRQTYGDLVFSPVPQRTAVATAAGLGQTVIEYRPNDDASVAIRQIASRLEGLKWD